MALDTKTELIKELREQLLLLKTENESLKKQNIVENFTHETIGIFRDKDKAYHTMYIGYNPISNSIGIKKVEKGTISFGTTSYRVREYVELKLLARVEGIKNE